MERSRLPSLLAAAQKAMAKLDAAFDAEEYATRALNREARRVAWTALEKRGIQRLDRIAFIDPKRARWHDYAPRLDGMEVYRSRPLFGERATPLFGERATWRAKLNLSRFNAKGKVLKTTTTEYFDLFHPRDIARCIVKVTP